jgi:hypothetical protein
MQNVLFGRMASIAPTQRVMATGMPRAIASEASAAYAGEKSSQNLYLEAARKRMRARHSDRWPSASNRGLAEPTTQLNKASLWYQAPAWGLINLPVNARAKVVEMNVAASLQKVANEAQAKVTNEEVPMVRAEEKSLKMKDQHLDAARQRMRSRYSARWPSEEGLGLASSSHLLHQAPSWGMIDIPKHVRARMVEIKMAANLLQSVAQEGQSKPAAVCGVN